MNMPAFPAVMGILNCTPDSFYSQSRVDQENQGWEQARIMIDEGAHILDIGGESSRPGAEYVSAQEELDRVMPLIQAVRKNSDIPISLDTRKSQVAQEAIKEGIEFINDISALQDDPRLANLAADHDLGLILMHKQGMPGTMQENPQYSNVVAEIKDQLLLAVETAMERGVKKDQIILDPGIGFGKTQDHNRQILRSIPEMGDWGFPLLIGLSRKSYIGNILDQPPQERLYGTLAADCFALIQGAQIVRVHDVKAHVHALKVLKDLLWNG